MSVFIPTITAVNLGDNTFKITVATAENLTDGSKIYSFSIQNTATQEYLYNETNLDEVFATYTGISEENLILRIATKSKNDNGNFSQEVSLRFTPEFITNPITFSCDISVNNNMHWTVLAPEHVELYGITFDYINSDNLNFNQSNWQHLYTGEVYISKDDEHRQLSAFCDVTNILQKEKYLLLKAHFIKDINGTTYTEYAYCSLPRYFPYKTQIISSEATRPCITRSYVQQNYYENTGGEIESDAIEVEQEDGSIILESGITNNYEERNGQWRQCRIQYHELYPLMSNELNEQLLNINNEPLYVAIKKEG